MNIKLILASCSPRRRELIKLFGLPYECVNVSTDEKAFSSEPSVAVCEISAQKAIAVYSSRGLSADEVVIGADTVVIHNGRTLGKPKDDADAKNTLQQLQGSVHEVYTGITLLYLEGGLLKQKSFAEKTEVRFAPVTDSEIDAYISTGDPLDKAGSYAIQGVFSVHISGINGDYNNVVGLPVARIYAELKQIFSSRN